jgi:hypothetical protein
MEEEVEQEIHKYHHFETEKDVDDSPIHVNVENLSGEMRKVKGTSNRHESF